MPFGADAAHFDLGLRPPQAPARAQATQALAVILGALGGLVWLAWCLTAWLKGRKKGPGGVTGTGGAGLGRTTLVLAVWGWLILGMMSLGPARLYHRYDARLQEMTVHDLQDEVTAWMGPAWKGAFFQAPG